MKSKVAIVGAGISGLECANTLFKSDLFEVKVFEANSDFGGRIRKKEGFCDYPLELGAEEIGGIKSNYYATVINQGGKILEIRNSDQEYMYYYPNGSNHNQEKSSDGESKLKKSNDVASLYPEIAYLRNLFEEMSDEITSDSAKEIPNLTFLEYLKNNNIPEKAFFYAEVLFGSECGTDLENLSIKGFYSNFNDAGHEYFSLINMSHYDILEKNYKELITNNLIQFNTQITHIDYINENKIILIDQHSVKYEFDKCVITIPIPQYKKINFIPHLNEEKIKALENIGFDKLGKLFLKFSKCLWPEDTQGIIIPGYANVYWPSNRGKSSQNFVLNSIIGGKNCRNLTEIYKKDKEEFLKTIFSNLNEALDLNAREFLVDYIWMDWGEEEFIGGGYSFMTKNEKEGDRERLKTPIQDRIFFAGEAFGIGGNFATMHGAHETGQQIGNYLVTHSKV